MSNAIAFDAHRFVKRLTENGFTQQRAETLAEEQVTLLNSNLAMKTDIKTLQVDIEGVRAHIEAVKAELIKWMFGAMLAMTGVFFALFKLL